MREDHAVTLCHLYTNIEYENFAAVTNLPSPELSCKAPENLTRQRVDVIAIVHFLSRFTRHYTIIRVRPCAGSGCMAQSEC